MRKKVLIVSPQFPPVNSPDSQRIRMSLPHYERYGWEAHILCVDEKYSNSLIDESLVSTVPEYITIKKITFMNL